MPLSHEINEYIRSYSDLTDVQLTALIKEKTGFNISLAAVKKRRQRMKNKKLSFTLNCIQQNGSWVCTCGRFKRIDASLEDAATDVVADAITGSQSDPSK